MKKAVLITILIAIGMILAGGAMVFVSMAATGFNIKNLAQTEEYEEKKFDITEDFTNINLDMDSKGLEILKSSDENTHLIVYEKEHEHFEVNVNDDTLEVVFKEDENVSWIDSLVILDIQTENNKLYLPKDTYDNVVAKVESGSLTSEIAITFGDTDITLGSGELNLANTTLQDLDITVGSGNIIMNTINAKDVNAKSNSGRIEIATITSKSLTADAGSGSIKIMGADVEESIKAKSSSGSVHCDDAKCREASLKSGSGSVNTMNVTCEGNFEGNTSSGSVNLFETVSGGDLKAKTGSGSIHLDSCDGANMELQTSSGSIKGTIKSGKIFETKTGAGSISVPSNDLNGGQCNVRTGSGSIKLELVTEE